MIGSHEITPVSTPDAPEPQKTALRLWPSADRLKAPMVRKRAKPPCLQTSLRDLQLDGNRRRELSVGATTAANSTQRAILCCITFSQRCL